MAVTTQKPGPSFTERKASSKSFVGFLKAVVAGDRRTLQQEYGSGYVSDEGPTSVRKAAMGETSGGAGGYLVPTEYTAKLLVSIAEHSFIYPRAFVWPMITGKALCPKVDFETTQATGTTPLFGGIKFTWGFQPTALVETEPTFRLMELRAWDLAGYATVSNQFLMDLGPEAEEALIKVLGQAAAWQAEYAFFNGFGAGSSMPLGILKAGATLFESRTTTNLITAADIAEMAGDLLPYSWTNAIWACSPTCLDQIVKLTTVYLNTHETLPGCAGYLVNRPLYVTDKLPPLGTAGDLVFFDPSLYVIGVRTEVLIDVSPHPGFKNFQTDFRVWLRVDGQPLVSSTITLVDGSTVVSPYVALAA